MALLAVALPRLVNTPEFRAALAARAGEALGTPVEWKSLTIGIFPPRVTLDEPVLVGQDVSAESAASVRAQAIDLRISLFPLLERRIAIESLVLHGVALVVTRTPDGFVLPDIARRAAQPEDGADESSGEDPAAGDGAFVLDLRELRLDEGRVLVRDRALSPPVDWRIDGLSLAARGRSLGDPLEIEASARAFANDRELGGVSATGGLDLEGEYALDFQLEKLLVAELRAFVPELELSAGELSGPVSVEGSGSALRRLTTDVEIAGLRLRMTGVDLSGDLGIRAQRKSDEKLDFEATWTPSDAGRAEITGERNASGEVELTAMLDALELAPFASLAGPGRTLAGRASGEVSLATAAGALTRVETDLVIDSARYADGKIDAAGKLDLALGLQGLAPEDPVRIQAVFAPTSGGRLDVNATGTVAGALRSALRFDTFDVSLLSPLLPEGTRFEGKLTGELELESTAERELLELEGRLRVGGARVVRAPVDVSGDLSLDARLAEGGPVELVAKATLADGGRVEVAGTSTRKGVLDLRTELSNFDLAVVTPFLDSPELSVAGRATGKGTLSGPYDALDSLALDLALAGSAIRFRDTLVEGPFTLALDLAKPFAPERRGTLALDLSDSRVAQGETFQKPAGVRLRATTKIERGEADRIVFDSRLELHNINELELRGTLGPKTVLTVTSSSFDLKGWSALLPALAAYEPAGMIAFEAFSLERSEGARDRFGGRIALRTVDLSLPGTGRIRVRGSGVGAGERIELSGFTATLHGLTLGIEGRVEDPLAAARFELAAHSIGEAEANDLISGLSSVRDVVFGALRFDAQLAGIAGGEAALLDTLAGTVRFTVGESGGGRLRGISLLRTTLAQIPLLGGATRLAAKLREQPGAPDYFGESFELLEGDLAIAAGEIEARTLRIQYRGHEARLTGRMQLESLGLDMRGELLLDSTLVAALTGRPASELAGRAPVRIQLARVTNTLSDPKVSLSPETLAAVPQLLLLTTGVGRIVDHSVEKAVGTVGKAVDRVLGGVNGVGGRRGGAASGQAGKPTVDEPIDPPAAAPAASPAVPPVDELVVKTRDAVVEPAGDASAPVDGIVPGDANAPGEAEAPEDESVKGATDDGGAVPGAGSADDAGAATPESDEAAVADDAKGDPAQTAVDGGSP